MPVMSDGDDRPPGDDDGREADTPADAGPDTDGVRDTPAESRSPRTDPRAPDHESRGRRLVVIGIVVVILGASIAAVGWAVTRSPDEPVAPPDASFDLSGTSAGAATLSHAGGESVAAERLVVDVDGDRATWAELRFDTGPEDTVAPGDAVTLVGVAEGDTVTVFYVEDGEEVPLANLTVTAA